MIMRTCQDVRDCVLVVGECPQHELLEGGEETVENLLETAVMEDVESRKPSASLWDLRGARPEIRQIYGHFLPPLHRTLVAGLVAKDFNFPSAYHAADGVSRLTELYEDGGGFTPTAIVSRNASVKTRCESRGAVVYTPYFNGFYMNRGAAEIWEHCDGETPVRTIASESGWDLATVMEFLARAIMLGLLDVRPS